MSNSHQRLDELAAAITSTTADLRDLKAEILELIRESIPNAFLAVTKNVVTSQHAHTNTLPPGKLSVLKGRVSALSVEPDILVDHVQEAEFWELHSQPIKTPEPNSTADNFSALEVNCHEAILGRVERTYAVLWKLLEEYGYERPIDTVPELPAQIAPLAEEYDQLSREVLSARLQAIILRQQQHETSEQAALRKWDSA